MTVTGLDRQIEIVNLTIACYAQMRNRAKTRGSPRRQFQRTYTELSRWRLAYALSF